MNQPLNLLLAKKLIVSGVRDIMGTSGGSRNPGYEVGSRSFVGGSFAIGEQCLFV